MIYYLKKGGSDKSNQPFFRSEMSFPKAYKMDKLIRCVSKIVLPLIITDIRPRIGNEVGQKLAIE